MAFVQLFFNKLKLEFAINMFKIVDDKGNTIK